jgi:hypothetical protein
MVRARQLIQKARRVPVPADGGRSNFAYIAQVKDLLRQARDLIKFLPNTPTATPEMKAEINNFRRSRSSQSRDSTWEMRGCLKSQFCHVATADLYQILY